MRRGSTACRARGPASRFFVERVTAYAAREPVVFLAPPGPEAPVAPRRREIPRNQGSTRLALSPVRRVLLWKVPGLAFPFGLLLPLAVVGLGVAWRRAPVLAASVVLVGLAVAPFSVRVVTVRPGPALAVFAAGASGGRPTRQAGGRRRGGRRRGLAVYLLANLGQGPMPSG